MPFPSIKGPCFHPARSGDRSFGLVSNAGAMTLPHFAVQTAIHSTLPSDTRCTYDRRDAPWRSLVQSAVVAATVRERARRGSDLIALKIETVLKEDMSDLLRLFVSMVDFILLYPPDFVSRVNIMGNAEL